MIRSDHASPLNNSMSVPRFLPGVSHRLDLDLVVGADRGSQKQARFPCLPSAERRRSGAQPM